jgi:hypothetical protein
MNYIIVFSDTNSAIKAEQSLINARLAVSVMPLPESIGAGCGITLRISSDSLQNALAALEAGGITDTAVYSRKKAEIGYEYEKITIDIG